MRLRVIRGLLVAAALAPAAGGARAAVPPSEDGAPGPPGGAADDVVATVNGEPIPRSLLISELLARHGEAVLEDLIREMVVEQAVARAGVAVSEGEIDVEIERERRAFAQQGKRLEAMVDEKYRMSMAGYRAIVRRWLLIRKLIVGAENPTEADVMLWFYRNRERLYDTPAEYTLRHIFVAFTDPRTGRERAPVEVQRRVEAVRNGVLKGEDFARLAARYSDDVITQDEEGRPIAPRPRLELGPVNERAARLHFEPNFVEAMVRLKVGQSGMVDTPKGYHFIQMIARKEGREAQYDDFRKIARADYIEDRALLRREVYLRQLMEKAEITRNLPQPEGAGGGGGPADAPDASPRGGAEGEP